MDQLIIDRTTSYSIVNRETGETYALDRRDWDALITLHLCDWMEQLARMNWWDYRREAYAAMASYLGGVVWHYKTTTASLLENQIAQLDYMRTARLGALDVNCRPLN